MMAEFPASIASSTVSIMGVDIVFHVLDNGEQIIEAESMHRFLEMLGAGVEMNSDDAMKLAKVVKGASQ